MTGPSVITVMEVFNVKFKSLNKKRMKKLIVLFSLVLLVGVSFSATPAVDVAGIDIVQTDTVEFVTASAPVLFTFIPEDIPNFAEEFSESTMTSTELEVLAKILDCKPAEVYCAEEDSLVNDLFASSPPGVEPASRGDYYIDDEGDITVNHTGYSDLDEDEEVDGERDCYYRLYEFKEGKILDVMYGYGSGQSAIGIVYTTKETVENLKALKQES
jgi:hypothetical protein